MNYHKRNIKLIIFITFKSDPDIQGLLYKRHEVEKEIQKTLLAKNIRFSSSKFVGDLGEYYFKLNLEKSIFLNLNQSATSNDSCDFIGTFTKEFSKKHNLPTESLRIEIKTRKFQKGNPQLF